MVDRELPEVGAAATETVEVEMVDRELLKVSKVLSDLAEMELLVKVVEVLWILMAKVKVVVVRKIEVKEMIGKDLVKMEL